MRTRTWGAVSLVAGWGLWLASAAQAQSDRDWTGVPGVAPSAAPFTATSTSRYGPMLAAGDASVVPGSMSVPNPTDDRANAPNSEVGSALSALTPIPNGNLPIADAQPITVRAQSFSPATPDYPIPVYRENIEQGGFFTAMEFIMWRMSVPLSHQLIAVRGFYDLSLGGGSGTLIGSGTPELHADDASGPGSWLPGWKFDIGWKFADGTVITADWTHIHEYTYHHYANVVPAGFHTNSDADSFLSSFVYNFGSAYAGPAAKPPQEYGLWNAADQMMVAFSQRYDQYDLSWRQTILQEDTYRCYGLIGPRFAWIWERFLWRTVASQAASELDIGVYNNIVSNRMYGVHFGSGTDYWLGNGFAATLEFQASPYLDIVREWAAYQLGDHNPLVRDKRSIRDYTIAGELEANVGLYWYPIQGVTAKIGYEWMGFFNTKSAKDPVDYNLGAIAPPWHRQLFRYFHGFDVGISFIF